MNKILRSVLEFAEVKDRPDLVVVEVTHKCNLKCSHCYNPSFAATRPTRKEPSTASLYQLIESIPDKENVCIAFSGGEPLCRKDLGELVLKSRDLGFGHVHIDTNGILLTPNKAGSLKRAGLKSVQISLDGLAARHEEMRGPGTFDKVLFHTRAALDAAVYVTLNLTVHSGNLEEIPGVYELATQLGVQQLKIEPLLIKGRATASFYRESAARYLERVCGQIREITADPKTSLVLDNLFQAAVSKEKTLGCPSGRTFCHVTLEGRLFHCPVFTEFACSEDDVTRRGFGEIWQESDFLKRLRDPASYRHACGNCVYLETCCGGCHARAKLASESFFGRDPMCAVLDKRKEG